MHMSDKQKEVLYFASDPGTIMLSVGTVRSGKTYSSVNAFFVYTQSLDSSFKHIIGGRKLRVLEQEVLPQLRELAHSFNMGYSYKRAEQIVYIGKQAYFVIAGNDETSMERVQGLTIHSSIVDEATLVPQNFFDTILARMTFKGGKMWVTCNPSYPLHWLKTKWIDTGKVDRHLQFTFEDNPSLSAEVIERNRSIFTGAFKKRMVEGLWAAAEGLVYLDPTIKKINYDKFKIMRTIMACDYGTASVSAFTVIQTLCHNDSKAIIYYIPESFHIEGGTEMKNKTDDQLVFMARQLVDKYDVKSVIVDKSATSFITALKCSPNRNYNVRKAINDVLPGIRTVDNLFTNNRLVVNPDCEDLIQELHSYSWDEKKADKPLKENDHHCDALRYGVMELIGKRAMENIALPVGF